MFEVIQKAIAIINHLLAMPCGRAFWVIVAIIVLAVIAATTGRMR